MIKKLIKSPLVQYGEDVSDMIYATSGLDMLEDDEPMIGSGPQGIDPDPNWGDIDPIGIGARDSGSAQCFPNGQRVAVLRAKLPQDMMTGLASVHVDCTDISPEPTYPQGVFITQKIVLSVRWQTGQGGGDCEVDATRGTVFTVGGVHSLEIDARIVSPNADPADPLVPGKAKRIEAVVHWKGAINPKACFFTSPRVFLAAGVQSAPIEIPKQAASVIILTESPVDAPGLIARFKWSAQAGARTIYRTDNPLLNGTPVVAGAEFLTLQSLVDVTVTPTWELYL